MIKQRYVDRFGQPRDGRHLLVSEFVAAQKVDSGGVDQCSETVPQKMKLRKIAHTQPFLQRTPQSNPLIPGATVGLCQRNCRRVPVPAKDVGDLAVTSALRICCAIPFAQASGLLSKPCVITIVMRSSCGAFPSVIETKFSPSKIFNSPGDPAEWLTFGERTTSS